MTNFLEDLSLIREGQAVIRCTEEWKDLIAAVVEHGGKGSFTLKLSVEPNGEGAVTITTDISVKQPKAGVGKAVFYAQPGGDLSRRDPRQRDIDEVLSSSRKDN